MNQTVPIPAQGKVSQAGSVARGRLMFFGGHNRQPNTFWWLHDNFPAARRLVAGRTIPT